MSATLSASAADTNAYLSGDALGVDHVTGVARAADRTHIGRGAADGVEHRRLQSVERLPVELELQVLRGRLFHGHLPFNGQSRSAPSARPKATLLPRTVLAGRRNEISPPPDPPGRAGEGGTSTSSSSPRRPSTCTRTSPCPARCRSG